MAQFKSRKYPQIECGDIYFLYRPAVGVGEAHGFKDVRRLYILLKPWGTQIYRLLMSPPNTGLGQKQEAEFPKRPTENELSDFSRLWHDGCGKTIIEAQNVD